MCVFFFIIIILRVVGEGAVWFWCFPTPLVPYEANLSTEYLEVSYFFL